MLVILLLEVPSKKSSTSTSLSVSVILVLILCYSCVILVLFLCYSRVILVLFSCYSRVILVLFSCGEATGLFYFFIQSLSAIVELRLSFINVHRLWGVIEGRVSHFLPRWFRTVWQCDQPGKSPLEYSATAGN